MEKGNCICVSLGKKGGSGDCFDRHKGVLVYTVLCCCFKAASIVFLLDTLNWKMRRRENKVVYLGFPEGFHIPCIVYLEKVLLYSVGLIPR